MSRKTVNVRESGGMDEAISKFTSLFWFGFHFTIAAIPDFHKSTMDPIQNIGSIMSHSVKTNKSFDLILK